MNDLIKIVYQLLTEVSDNVYFQKAPQDASLPYIVFSFPNEGRGHRGQIEKVLEIHIYDCEREDYFVADSIETMADSINNVLDYITDTDTNYSYWFRRISRISVPYPPESNIWHRELRYSMKTYKL